MHKGESVYLHTSDVAIIQANCFLEESAIHKIRYIASFILEAYAIYVCAYNLVCVKNKELDNSQKPTPLKQECSTASLLQL